MMTAFHLVLFVLQIMDQAVSLGAPIIGLNDSGGARIQVLLVTALLCYLT